MLDPHETATRPAMASDPKRVQEVFLAACDAADAADRENVLDRECGGDANLRVRVEELLAAHDRSGDFLAATQDSGANRRKRGRDEAETAADVASTSKGRTIAGRYKLLELIGEGGMGAVWMAEQREPVKRLVAVKLVKPGMDSAEVIARFEAERQALALMDHPNIARVFDGGATAEGRPYFAMELVKGLSITDYCDQRQLSLKDRLALFAQVCAAVQHAHQKGILHRDLKPTNVLVTEHDGTPVPKVIDFGLAKALHANQSLTDRTLHTAYGAVVGTPLYMAPEQVGINAVDVDTRADVYALGAMLYELLTGTPPLERKTFKEAAWNEVVRLIREQDPPRPSVRISSSSALPSIAAQRNAEPARLSRLVRGDLDWIVMKALEKDRGRRYETANGLARDVQRYLADEAIEARPPSRAYLASKFIRRHRMATIFAAIVALCLLAGVAGTTIGMVRAEFQRADAETARGLEVVQRKIADERRVEADGERVRAEQATSAAIVARDDALVAREEAQRQLVRADLSAGRLQSDEGRPEAALHWLVKAWNEDLATNRSAEDRRDADDRHRLRIGRTLEEMPRLVGFCLHDRPVIEADCDSGGHRVVTVTGENVAYVWDARRGEITATLRHESPVIFALLLPDGERIAAGAADGTLRLWNASDGVAIRSWTAPGAVRYGTLSPDGASLAVATDRGGAVYALDALPEPKTKFSTDQTIDYAGFDPTGKRLATASVDRKEARVWDAASGEALSPPLRFGRVAWNLPEAERRFAIESRRWPTFSPGGTTVASCDERSIDFWNAERGVVTRQVNFGANAVRIDVSFASEDSAAFIQRGRGAGVSMIDWASGAVVDRPFAISRQPCAIFVDAAKSRALVPITGGVVEILAFPSLESSGRTFRCAGAITVLRSLASGERTLVAGSDGSVRIYEGLESESGLRPYAGACGAADRFSMSGLRSDATGQFSLVAVSGGCEFRREGDESGPKLEHPDAQPIRVSRDGRFAVTASPIEAKVWSLGDEPRLLKSFPIANVCWAAFSDDGERLAMQSSHVGPLARQDVHSTFYAWRTDDFEKTLEAYVPRANYPSENATLTLLATGQRSVRELSAWDAVTGKSLGLRPIRTGHVAGVAFGPDDRLCVPVSDGTIQQLDPRTGGLAGPTIPLTPYAPRCVAYSPDGRFLACVSSGSQEDREGDAASGASRTLHLIDARTGEVLARQGFADPAFRPAGPEVWFSVDGRRLILHEEGQPWVREYELPRYAGDVVPLSLFARLLTATSSDAFGAMSPLPTEELIERRDEYLEAWRAVNAEPSS